MSLSRFRLITFDVANTLLKYRYSPAKHYGEVGALFGVICDTKELAKNFIHKWHEMNEKHPNFGRYSDMGWEKWWREIVSDTFHRSGVKLSGNHLDKLSNQFIEVYKTSAFWQYCYGASELLEYMKTQQKTMEGNEPFVLGIIANFDPRLNDLLKNLKINHYFNFILNSYECNAEKPKTEIFNIAMESSKLKNLNPDECLHIGDGPVTDCVGSRRAGWHSALIHEKDQASLTKEFGKELSECHLFSSLFDLQRRFASGSIKW